MFDPFCYIFPFPETLPPLFFLYTVLPSTILATLPNHHPKPNPNPNTNPSYPPLYILIRMSVRSFVLWIFEIGLSHLA